MQQLLNEMSMSSAPSGKRALNFPQIGSGSVQHTAKGADGRIMSYVEKGMIQHAIALLRKRDNVAWSWGMIAYAPPGTANGFERAILCQWLRERFYAHPDHAEFAGYRHTRDDVKLRGLALIAALDIAREDVTGLRRRRKYADLARAISVPGGAEEYQRDWHRHYVFFRDLVKTLPERALPPIATVMWRIAGLEESESPVEAQACAEELRGVLAVKA
jgi:hypothetical protein